MIFKFALIFTLTILCNASPVPNEEPSPLLNTLKNALNTLRGTPENPAILTSAKIQKIKRAFEDVVNMVKQRQVQINALAKPTPKSIETEISKAIEKNINSKPINEENFTEESDESNEKNVEAVKKENAEKNNENVISKPMVEDVEKKSVIKNNFVIRPEVIEKTEEMARKIVNKELEQILNGGLY